jgi:putative addiction module component (TIGR02574 family)
MSQALPLPPPGFDALTVDEQIDYLQSLWDRIAAHPEQVPVPAWHREIIAERLADFRTTPDEGKTWEQFDRELIAELQSHSAIR